MYICVLPKDSYFCYMTIAELKIQLENANHSTESRHLHSVLILENKTLFPKLFTIAQETNNPVSYRAMWVLEFVCRENLSAILSYLPPFIKTIQTVHLQPAVRPAAKICEFLTHAYYNKNGNKNVKNKLTKTAREQIATCCFDWLIDSKTKVASKAYSMTALYLLGTEFNWIHPELKLILEQNYHSGSAAYKARSRMILEKLK